MIHCVDPYCKSSTFINCPPGYSSGVCTALSFFVTVSLFFISVQRRNTRSELSSAVGRKIVTMSPKFLLYRISSSPKITPTTSSPKLHQQLRLPDFINFFQITLHSFLSWIPQIISPLSVENSVDKPSCCYQSILYIPEIRGKFEREE